MKETIIWNAEQGMRLSALEVKKAEEARTNLYVRMADFMGRYDFLVLPVTSVPPFSADEEYPREVAGKTFDELPGVDGAVLVDHCDRPACDLGARGIRSCRPACWTANRRTATRGFRFCNLHTPLNRQPNTGERGLRSFSRWRRRQDARVARMSQIIPKLLLRWLFACPDANRVVKWV